MKSVAAALVHLLQLLRPRLLIIRAVALLGEITFTCKKIGFAEALDSIVATDKRYSREAYVFLQDVLDKLGWLCSRGKWILDGQENREFASVLAAASTATTLPIRIGRR
jgi:hypothetical protein